MSIRSYYNEASRLPGASRSFNIQPGESAVVLFDPLIEPKDAKFQKHALGVMEYDEDEDGHPLWTPRTLYVTTEEMGRIVRLLKPDDSRVCLLVVCDNVLQTNRDGTIRVNDQGEERYSRVLRFSHYELAEEAMPERVVPNARHRLAAMAVESSKLQRTRPLPKPLT